VSQQSTAVAPAADMSPSAEMSAARRAGRLSKTCGLPERLPMARIMHPECVQDGTRGWWVCHGCEPADGASPSSGGRRASGCGHRSSVSGSRATPSTIALSASFRALEDARPRATRRIADPFSRAFVDTRLRAVVTRRATGAARSGVRLHRSPVAGRSHVDRCAHLRYRRPSGRWVAAGSGRSCCWARATTPAHTGCAAETGLPRGRRQDDQIPRHAGVETSLLPPVCPARRLPPPFRHERAFG
jgi:hypothetical protein